MTLVMPFAEAVALYTQVRTHEPLTLSRADGTPVTRLLIREISVASDPWSDTATVTIVFQTLIERPASLLRNLTES